RYNLASEPSTFAENETVRAFLQVAGSSGLPLILVDGVTAMTGRYPDRTQLAAWAGIEGGAGTNLLDAGESCCGSDGSDTSGCC
ncbi:arsenical pump-driving ATPase, partial [Mycobacterium sp. ITM-2017-0098]